MEKAPISVVIPAYNSEKYISEALNSVDSQSLSVDEIIVVDNNCSDNTRIIAEEAGAKVVDEKKQGISAARNKGIGVCKNDWIAFLDSDDVWAEEKIEYQWNAIKKFPKARIISCDSGWIFKDDGTREDVPVMNKAAFYENPEIIMDPVFSYAKAFTGNLSGWFLMNSTMMVFHREVFDVVGLLDEDLSFAQDMEFVYRALARFPIATVKKNLAYIRRHENNRTNDRERFFEGKMRVARQMKKFPEKYPPGIFEFLIENEKRYFLEKGRFFSQKINDQKVLNKK